MVHKDDIGIIYVLTPSPPFRKVSDTLLQRGYRP